MPREYYYLLIGIIIGLLPMLGYVVYKKSGLFETHPDRIITYSEENGIKLTLHVFNAKSKKQSINNPAILFFHGGAWKYGHPQQFYKQCLYFSNLGLTCISAQYRIESIHGTDPRASTQDSRKALVYLHQHALDLKINSKQIIVSGGSAGGHLAATLGVPIPLTLDKENASTLIRPSAMILYNPMIDLAPCKPDHRLVSEFWAEVSPMQHIDDSVPPTLVLLGTEDSEVSVATAKSFCETITKQHVSCELELYEGAKHGFFNHNVENGKYFDKTNERITQFLKQMGYLN